MPRSINEMPPTVGLVFLLVLSEKLFCFRFTSELLNVFNFLSISKEFRKFSMDLSSPPSGYDSCHGLMSTEDEPSDFKVSS